MANTNTPYVKFSRGSIAAYEALSSYNKDTLYFVTDPNSKQSKLYLGDELITSEITSLYELKDILVAAVADKQLLVYDAESGKWINKSVIDAIGVMTGATAEAQGSIGLVPAPAAGQEGYFLRGDGKWAPIESASATQVFETILLSGETKIEAIERQVNGVALNKGDVAIVKQLIANDKYEYTAYVYNGTAWAAMDGNYSADNVYFDSDFIFTKAVGTVSTIPSSGSTTKSAAGKSMKEFFSTLFAEEEYPTVPSVSATLVATNAGSKEVGTNIPIQYRFDTSAGGYKYGPSNNGVEFSDYSATFNGETLTTKSGTFTTVQVTDDTNLVITGSCKSSDGVIPTTNLGNEYPAAQIKAKEFTGLKSGSLTGYRAWFCGYKDGDSALADATAITGDQVRALGNASNGSWKSQMTVNKMKQMFFACPAGKGYKPTVKDHSTTAPQTVLGPLSIQVPGANGYNPIAYDVYYVSNADAASGSATLDISK